MTEEDERRQTAPRPIAPRHTISAEGYPDTLTAVVDYNNEMLIPAWQALQDAHRAADDAIRRALQFFAGARTLCEYVQLLARYAPARRTGYVNDLMNETVIFYGEVRSLLQAYPLLEITHPSIWAEREDAVLRGLAALHAEPYMDRLTAFFAVDSPVAESLKADMREHLNHSVQALSEQLARTQAERQLGALIVSALDDWHAARRAITDARTVFDLLLASGSVVSSSIGNMPDYGDSVAVGILRWRLYRTMLAASTERPEHFQVGLQQLGRAANLSGAEVRNLEQILRRRCTTREEAHASFTQAAEIVEARFQTEAGLSGGLTVLSGLQLLGAIMNLRDPEPDEIQEYVNAGTSAYFTFADVVGTTYRASQSAAVLGMRITTLMKAVEWLGPRVGVLAAGAGMIFGGLEFIEGVREGDSQHVLVGGINFASGALIGLAALGEIFAFSASVAWAGPAGALLGAAGAVIGLYFVLEGLQGRAPDPTEDAVRGLIRTLAGEGPADRALRSAGERLAQAESAYPYRGPDHELRALIDVIDRETNTNLREHLDRILHVAGNIRFETMHVQSPEERDQLLRRLRSLGFNDRSGETRAMIRTAPAWARSGAEHPR